MDNEKMYYRPVACNDFAGMKKSSTSNFSFFYSKSVIRQKSRIPEISGKFISQWWRKKPPIQLTKLLLTWFAYQNSVLFSWVDLVPCWWFLLPVKSKKIAGYYMLLHKSSKFWISKALAFWRFWPWLMVQNHELVHCRSSFWTVNNLV